MITSYKVVKMCIRHNYYTCGSRAHYDYLLEKITPKEIKEEIFTVDEIRGIAADIYYHSNYTEDKSIAMDSILMELENM